MAKTNKEACNKCKDCKFFTREGLNMSRSGYCTEPSHINSEFVKEFGNCLIGCGTRACGNFKK